MWFTKKAMKHVSRGDFLYRKRKPIKMTGGGHGQANIEYLNKHKIRHCTVFTYQNGVRLGNVSIHRREKCRTKGSQCWFPKEWDTNDVRKAAEHVTSLKRNANKGNNEVKYGSYKGVKIGVYATDKKIKTVFPWYIQRSGR